MASQGPSLDSFKRYFLEDLEHTAPEIERTGQLPAALIRKAAELGAFRLTAPAADGGFGLDEVAMLPYLEVAAMGPAVGRMLVHVTNGIWRPLARFGTPEQRDLIRRISAGDILVGFAATERDGGGGRDMRTRATRSAHGWRLQGEKYLITFADLAQVFIVLAITETDAGTRELSTFLVRRDQPGVQAAAEPLLGLAGIRLGTLTFDADLAGSQLLGRPGDGLLVLKTFLDHSRLSLAACMVGASQRALDESVAFAKRRVTFGKPIAERQAIQVRLADMYAELLAARSTVRAVGELARSGTEFTAEAAAAKLFCANVATRLADGCLQIHGGYGLTTASVAQRIARDSRSWWMEEGTAEIQQLLISRSLLA